MITFAFSTPLPMPSYNIIGDIHGRDTWKRLVAENCINIFVGDYFDPYLHYSFDVLERNFLEITEFKNKHNHQVVLLYGNHDMSYFPDTRDYTNRYDFVNAKRIQGLLDTTKELFHGVAYAIRDEYLVTHAGVTCLWKENYLPDLDDINPTNMAEAINDLWNKTKTPFTFMPNHHDAKDHNGEDPHQSPLWVRPESLCMNNLYAGTSIKQIVGHTKVKKITEVAGIILVDCLDAVEKTYKVI